MFFSTNLKLLRVELGLTQEQFAAKLGVSRLTVSKWEAGERVPSILSGQEIAHKLGVSMDRLIAEPILETSNAKRQS
jgi:transcriptional regulator with XRE-family HTH domain